MPTQEDTDDYTLHVNADQPTTIDFSVGDHVLDRFDMCYFEPTTNSVCATGAITPLLSAWLDENLHGVYSMPEGTYFLCCREGDSVTAFHHITAISQPMTPRPPPPPGAPPMSPEVEKLSKQVLVFDVEMLDFIPETVLQQLQMQQMMQQQQGGATPPPGAIAPPAGR